MYMYMYRRIIYIYNNLRSHALIDDERVYCTTDECTRNSIRHHTTYNIILLMCIENNYRKVLFVQFKKQYDRRLYYYIITFIIIYTRVILRRPYGEISTPNCFAFARVHSQNIELVI